MPEAETTLFLLNPSSHRDMPLRPDFTGDSGPIVESDNIVQESAPFVRMGIVTARLELLFPICDLFLWYLIQNKAEIAKSTPITTPIEIPMINPEDSPFISVLLLFAIQAPGPFTQLQQQYLVKKCYLYSLRF